MSCRVVKAFIEEGETQQGTTVNKVADLMTIRSFLFGVSGFLPWNPYHRCWKVVFFGTNICWVTSGAHNQVHLAPYPLQLSMFGIL